MTAHATPKRTPWEDRFREPSVEELLRGVASSAGAEMARDIRKRLLSFEGITEKIEWQGVPWRWSLVYSCAMDPTRAFAYLIPEPAKAQLAIPLTASMVQALPLKRMKKACRDGILYARFVAGVHWPCWTLDSVSQGDELVEVLQRKYRGVVGEWGGSGGGGTGAGGGGGAGADGPPGAAGSGGRGGKKSDSGR